jgi:hypothetical protein
MLESADCVDAAERQGRCPACVTEFRRTPEQAEHERFLGSPTVRIEGTDVDPTGAGRDEFGFECRLYRTDQGLVRTPPQEWIRTALGRAA